MHFKIANRISTVPFITRNNSKSFENTLTRMELSSLNVNHIEQAWRRIRGHPGGSFSVSHNRLVFHGISSSNTQQSSSKPNKQQIRFTSTSNDNVSFTRARLVFFLFFLAPCASTVTSPYKRSRRILQSLTAITILHFLLVMRTFHSWRFP